MKRALNALTACAVVSLFCFATCSKKDDKDDDPTVNKMTIADLTGSANKDWTIMKVERTYYSADGKIDSTFTREALSSDEMIQFSTGPTIGDKTETHICRFPLNSYIPDFGTWTLLSNPQRLTFSCYVFSCDPYTVGTWDISDYGKSAYGSSFNIQRIFSLENGRTLKVWAHLYADR
ncbi:hypothetical protein [Chitinophaga pinensis]|uniref:Lipoprotein n=1 Tax=Chitinophaga pinensis (strain ATCC 43595 / DSM 2588 / LMG 13176 / NBRC 15968 / NCIMB 11800 / UQM 2034) TaxID=485918 RepID=A0A979GAD3_CHIPD|nr:hypothetical protein [Chitinophaga pinensis]ACU63746.1 hypothetical protein Cpin_6341 [Chitinophaga pinensis DSM 2588]